MLLSGCSNKQSMFSIEISLQMAYLLQKLYTKYFYIKLFFAHFTINTNIKRFAKY